MSPVGWIGVRMGVRMGVSFVFEDVLAASVVFSKMCDHELVTLRTAYVVPQHISLKALLKVKVRGER